MPNAAIDPITDPATTPGCCAVGLSLEAVLDPAVAEFVCVAMDESVVEKSRSERPDEENEVGELVERVMVRVWKIVDVPVVVTVIVLPMPTSLACVTPMKGDAGKVMKCSNVPDKSLAPVELEPSVVVLVTWAAENNVFVTVIVGEPLGP